jgi:hypothetical protein
MKRPEEVGLCATCRHMETIASTRGSRFYLCQFSLIDPRFKKYPVLPMLACEAFELVLQRVVNNLPVHNRKD